MPSGWFRARIEEALMASMAIPLYLTTSIGRLVDELTNEAAKLGYQSTRKVLNTLRAAVITGLTPSTVKGLLPSIVGIIYTAERLGVEPGVVILEVNRELEHELTDLVSTYRDLAILTDMLVILLLVIMPMVVSLVGQALGLPIIQFLIINYALATPISLLLLFNLDPGILRLNKTITTRLTLSLIPMIITYVLTKSLATSWLITAVAFLALTLRYYMNYNNDVKTMNWRVRDSLITSSMGIKHYKYPVIWNHLDNFFTEYVREIATTGMGRPEVISTALTTATNVITTIKDVRRTSTYASIISTAFIIMLMTVITIIIHQTPIITTNPTWLLPTAILGGFFSGYIIDSIITGVYFTIPTTITYIIITLLLH